MLPGQSSSCPGGIELDNGPLAGFLPFPAPFSYRYFQGSHPKYGTRTELSQGLLLGKPQLEVNPQLHPHQRSTPWITVSASAQPLLPFPTSSCPNLLTALQPVRPAAANIPLRTWHIVPALRQLGQSPPGGVRVRSGRLTPMRPQVPWRVGTALDLLFSFRNYSFGPRYLLGSQQRLVQ